MNYAIEIGANHFSHNKLQRVLGIEDIANLVIIEKTILNEYKKEFQQLKGSPNE